MSEKIIFLDINGVLRPLSGGDCNRPFVSSRCVDALNKVFIETKAKIVLSSTWRYVVFSGSMNIDGLQTLLHTHDIQGDLIGVTRMDSDDSEVRESRWKQISDWLKRNTDRWSKFAIIDDDPDAFGGRPGVQTNSATGLTMDDAKQVIEILNER